MKAFLKGAIVSHDDLAVFAGALELACQHIEMIISSDFRPNKAFHDAKYRRHMGALRESLRIYKRALRCIERVQKAKAR
jgi:hypothetical protein